MFLIRYADDSTDLLFSLVEVPYRGFICTGYGEGDSHAVIAQVRMDGKIGVFDVHGEFPEAGEIVYAVFGKDSRAADADEDDVIGLVYEGGCVSDFLINIAFQCPFEKLGNGVLHILSHCRRFLLKLHFEPDFEFGESFTADFPAETQYRGSGYMRSVGKFTYLQDRK